MSNKKAPRHYAGNAVLDKDGVRWNRKPGTAYWLSENAEPGTAAMSDAELHSEDRRPVYMIPETVDG